jgi:phosphoglycerate dehydrogenase-like enzyme
MTTKVLIIDVHAEIYAERLRREFPDLKITAARDHSEVPTDLSGVNVIMSFGLAITDDIIARSRVLKWIQSFATGVDHFLRCPSLKPDVLITSGRGIHGPPMREAVLYMMMAISRDATRQVGDNKAHFWERRFWNLLYGKTAVIVGIGVVGIAIAEALKALGMRVVGVTRTPRDIACFDEIIRTSRLPDAARKADYLINVVPASDENAELFGRDVFATMKATAYFINAGRGQTVDEAALLEVLRERRIAGAALDVFQVEPLPADSPFWELPNVFITPHVGGYIIEYEDLILPLIVENMRLFLAGRPGEMQNIVAR